MNDSLQRRRRGKLAVAACVFLPLAGCGGASRIGASPTPMPPTARVTSAPEPSASPAAPASPQAFATDAAPDGFDDPDRVRHVDAIVPSLEALVKSEIEASKLPSLAVAVVVDGRTVLAKVEGFQDLATHAPATSSTVYRIGSITKTFTAAALLRLRDEGKVDLEAPASRWLPEIAHVALPHADDAPITLRALLTHSSGLPRLGAFDGTRADRDTTEAEVLAALDTRAAFDPGTASVYSNFGFSLAGIIVGRAAGSPYRSYVERTILEPLQMTSSSFDPATLPRERMAVPYVRKAGQYEAVPYWRLGAAEAAGGIFSSLDDMVRYASFQLAAWPPRDDQDAGPVKRASVRESHQTAFADALDVRKAGAEGTRAESDGVGLAWQTRTTCDYEQIVWHNGGTEGESAALYLAPQRGFGIVLLSNASDAPLDALAAKMLDRIAASNALPARRPRPRKALTELAARFVTSLDDCSDALIEGTFASSFRKAIPPETIRAICTTMRGRHGACALDGVEHASANSALLRATCTKGRLMIDASLADDGRRLSGMRLVSEGFAPSAALKSEAARGIAKADPTFGRCKLGSTDRSDGQGRAIFPLTCERGEAELDVSIGPGGHARPSVVRARPSTARCR